MTTARLVSAAAYGNCYDKPSSGVLHHHRGHNPVAATAAFRVVIYARYSSDRSRDESFEDQIYVCRSYAERHGWIVHEVLQDAANSGASSFRSGYQTLLEQARLRRFDIVVSEALDRLSRDQSDVAGLYKRLTFAGIAIHVSVRPKPSCSDCVWRLCLSHERDRA